MRERDLTRCACCGNKLEEDEKAAGICNACADEINERLEEE